MPTPDAPTAKIEPVRLWLEARTLQFLKGAGLHDISESAKDRGNVSVELVHLR